MAKNEKNLSRKTAALGSAFDIVESYKTLRANLLFALASTDKKIVVLSAAEPNAGKSTTSSNLAVVVAQTGSRVLLVDGDLRKPTLHRTFRVSRTDGLTKHLVSKCDWEACVCKEVAPNLDLMPSGPIPPNPSELLGSQRMSRFLDWASEKYDYIFIDTPPVNVVTDGLILSARAAGTILVARQNKTTYDELNEAVQSVENVGGNLLGVIINDCTFAAAERQRQYYRWYGYGYGSTVKD